MINFMKYHKASRRNSVLLNVTKALNKDYKDHLLHFIRFQIEYDFTEYKDWYVASMKPLPMKGDLTNSNNQR